MTVQVKINRGGAASALLSPAAPPRIAREPLSTVALISHGESPGGDLLEAVAAEGLEPAVVDGVLPDPRSLQAAVLLGSARVHDAADAGYLDAELEWLRRADDAGTPVLGIGHGARALALAFGGIVEPAEHPIRGWVMVDTSVPHLIPTGPWLTWQHDVIVLPGHAQLLAHNRLGPQAFRLGRHLGVQFHPEASARTVARWVARDDGHLDSRLLLAAIDRDANAAAACAQRLFATFMDTL
ncbi:MAG: type 1 glutamine amidotransferase [Solirubrobacteraceae bacterium]